MVEYAYILRVFRGPTFPFSPAYSLVLCVTSPNMEQEKLWLLSVIKAPHDIIFEMFDAEDSWPVKINMQLGQFHI